MENFSFCAVFQVHVICGWRSVRVELTFMLYWKKLYAQNVKSSDTKKLETINPKFFCLFP